jgi:hypothetical protein
MWAIADARRANRQDRRDLSFAEAGLAYGRRASATKIDHFRCSKTADDARGSPS